MLTLLPVGLIASAPAIADTNRYLAYLNSIGVSYSDIGQDKLVQLGQQTCSTASRQPTMQVVDLAMQLAMSRENVGLTYARARPLVVSALSNLCPGISPRN